MADDDMWGISMARSIISAVVRRLLASELIIISSDASDKLRNLEAWILPQLPLFDLQTIENNRRHELEILMRELKSAFYEADDILDEAEYRRLEEQVDGSTSNQIPFMLLQNVFTDLTIILTELLKKIEKLIDDVEKTVANLPRTEATGRYDARNLGLSSDEPTKEDLLWSYHHLDEQLKRCFAYCCIFPREHQLRRDEIINMWMAEGFIKTSGEGDEDMEEVGARYFDELVEASFLKPTQRLRLKFYEINEFKINDMLHDLAEKVAGSDGLRIEDGWSGEAPKDVRHLVVQTSLSKLIIEEILKQENLRTLIIYTDIGDKLTEENLFERIFTRLRKLRVLRVHSHHYNVYPVPASIGQLKHLRYLAFRFHTPDLPSTFSKLYHIQTLDFGPCRNLSFLSVHMANLINLHHINIEYPDETSFPNIGRLTLLKVLPLYTVRMEQGYEIHQLEHLNKLSGRMQIHGLQNVQSKDEAAKAELSNKEGLTDLTLHWDDDSCNPDVQANVLEGLCPPMCLPKLRIVGYRGMKYPSWMVGEQNVPNELGELELFRCNLEQPFPSRLCNFFSRLRSLVLHQCSWDALPEFLKDLPELGEMIIYGCMKLRSLPVLPRSLYYLQIDDCDDDFMTSCRTSGHPNWQKINHIPELFVGREPIDSPRFCAVSMYFLYGFHRIFPHLKIWTLDTMAWHHHTPCRWLLVDELPSSDEGNYQLQTGSVKTRAFKVPRVRYVQEATRNVISVVQLASDHGLVTVFEPTCCHVEVKETGEIIGEGRLCQGQYLLDYLRIHQIDDDIDMQDEEGAAGGPGGGDSDGGVDNNGQGIDREPGRGRGGSTGGYGDDIGGDYGGDIGGEGGGEKKEKEQDDKKGQEDDEDMKEEQEEEEEERRVRMGMFGLSRHLKDDMYSTGAFSTLANDEHRPGEFLVDSGACFHLTWNKSVLYEYPEHLRNFARPPIDSIGGILAGSINVTESGYLNSEIMLDGVLLAPNSTLNLVSVGQLVRQYGVKVEMCMDVKIWKPTGGPPIGSGEMNRRSQHPYVLKKFQPGRLFVDSPPPHTNFFGEDFFNNQQ
nr:putative NBS-LRR class RGA [Oryza barthii]BBF89316.1 putative NBS-LRR class RGA [Oryza barthii]